jgi:hypothetical protein
MRGSKVRATLSSQARTCISMSLTGYSFPTELHNMAGFIDNDVGGAIFGTHFDVFMGARYPSKSSFPNSARFGSPGSSSASRQAIRMDWNRDSPWRNTDQGVRVA